MKIFFAYLSLIIANIILVIFALRVLGYIDFRYIDAKILLFIVILPLSIIYHIYKPMPLKEVILKYFNIKLPSWETISYKLKILIGIDPKILEEESKKDQK